MNELAFWGPVIVLGFAGFVAAQRARECRTPEGIARERAAMRRLEGWTNRYRPQAGDYTPQGQRYWRAALILQGLTIAYVVGYTVVHAATH